jgi:UDP-N-acetylmuramoyl-tripeptide--D-alanyl-D-alanine ligase
LPPSGVAILNADDPIVTRMDRRTVARAVRYGFAEGADVQATDVASAGTRGMRFRLRTPAGVREVTIPVLGRLSVHNAAAGAAVGLAAGIDLDTIVAALGQGWSAPHRVELVALRGMTVIDDSYNASPGSVTAALELLAELPGRHVAVLGEMLELGKGSATGHRDVGTAAAATCDLLVVVGQGAHGIAVGAREAGLDASRIIEVRDREGAVDLLQTRLQPGDVVLIKASRGVELDRLVPALLELRSEAWR